VFSWTVYVTQRDCDRISQLVMAAPPP
jgi:uncharacterized protein YbaA (DUF1428 family)